MGKAAKAKTTTVTMVNDPSANPVTKLRKGRHQCDCQARTHELVHNCLNCGRVVCAQEGSGPCFFCGELVVNREEREILENGSNTQRKKLMIALTGKAEDNQLAKASEDFQRAQKFRDSLLKADIDVEKQKNVNDLDSDYHNIEQSSHLTAEERAAIIKRKEELVELDKARHRQLTISFNSQGEVFEEKQDRITAGKDPVIRAIIEKSLNRKNASEANHKASKTLMEENCNAKNFKPFYDKAYGQSIDKKANARNWNLMERDEVLLQANEEILHHEIEKAGYCIALDQPFATVALTENVEYLQWHEETAFRGPAFVASTTRIPSEKEIAFVSKMYSLKSNLIVEDLPIGAILGRIVVEQCWRAADFMEELRENRGQKEKVDIKSPFVLIVSHARSLDTPIPHIATARLGILDAQIKAIARRQFGAYEMS